MPNPRKVHSRMPETVLDLMVHLGGLEREQLAEVEQILSQLWRFRIEDRQMVRLLELLSDGDYTVAQITLAYETLTGRNVVPPSKRRKR